MALYLSQIPQVAENYQNISVDYNYGPILLLKLETRSRDSINGRARSDYI